jgi:hypothetical protein
LAWICFQGAAAQHYRNAYVSTPKCQAGELIYLQNDYLILRQAQESGIAPSFVFSMAGARGKRIVNGFFNLAKSDEGCL